ncbi:hypothetical protein ABT297_40700 [Dactylosporangium sp. NPDC000555]
MQDLAIGKTTVVSEQRGVDDQIERRDDQRPVHELTRDGAALTAGDV